MIRLHDNPIRLVGLLLVYLGFCILPTLSADDEKEEANPPKNLKTIEVPEVPSGTPAATPGSSARPEIENPLVPSDISPMPKNLPKNVVYDRSTELIRAAATTPYPELRPFLAKYAVAFDQLYEPGRKITRITPVPPLWGSDNYPPKFGVSELDERNQPQEVLSVESSKVFRVVPFERIALKDVEELLNPKEPDPTLAEVPTEEILSAAEQVLTRVLFFHSLAVEKQQRRSPNRDHWKPIQEALYQKLTDVRVKRIEELSKTKQWTKLAETSERLLRLYDKQPEITETIYAARLGEAVELVESERITDLERGRELLNEYDSRFPTSGNAVAKKVRDRLGQRAETIMNDAQRALRQDQSQARNLLKTVEAIDPDNAQLRNMQQTLRSDYPVLIVGTRRMPEFMSPTLARLDSEHWGVELMFEGLMERVPDKELGVRFVPTLAVVAAGSRSEHS